MKIRGYDDKLHACHEDEMKRKIATHAVRRKGAKRLSWQPAPVSRNNEAQKGFTMTRITIRTMRMVGNSLTIRQ